MSGFSCSIAEASVFPANPSKLTRTSLFRAWPQFNRLTALLIWMPLADAPACVEADFAPCSCEKIRKCAGGGALHVVNAKYLYPTPHACLQTVACATRRIPRTDSQVSDMSESAECRRVDDLLSEGKKRGEVVDGRGFSLLDRIRCECGAVA